MGNIKFHHITIIPYVILSTFVEAKITQTIYDWLTIVVLISTITMLMVIDNNISTSGRTFGPTSVNWGEKYDDITLDDSEVIPGFSKTLWKMGKMRKGSKAIGMFYSGLGYGYSGSTNIPGYAPLIFEIEFVEKPEIQ